MNEQAASDNGGDHVAISVKPAQCHAIQRERMVSPTAS
jgi:hypothetical protein